MFPFRKFRGADILLGPEMRSTGEVMGIGATVGEAFLKAMQGADLRLPTGGTVFISVNENDKENVLPIARTLFDLGFSIMGTRGTTLHLFDAGIPARLVYKVNEGNPNVVDFIERGEVQMVMNSPLGRDSRFDEKRIRVAASERAIPVITTLTGAEAACAAMVSRQQGQLGRFALQDWTPTV